MALKIILFIILAIVIFIIYNLISKQLRINKCKNAILEIFPTDKVDLPEFKMGSSYWYPTLELIFKYQEDYDYAKHNNLFQKYLSKVQSIYSDIDNFEAERAVMFKSHGKRRI